MYRIILVVAAAALMAGCQSSGTAESGQQSDAQLAAYAASSNYPTTAPSSTANAGVLVSPDGKTVQIINFSDQGIRDGKVWINGMYVAPLNSLPAHGSVTLNRDSFYDRSGQKLSNVNAGITTVQLETPDHLFNLLGPVYQR